MNPEEILIEADRHKVRCTGILLDKSLKKWKVNFRHDDGHYEYGYGVSPVAAILDGWKAVKARLEALTKPAQSNIDDMF